MGSIKSVILVVDIALVLDVEEAISTASSSTSASAMAGTLVQILLGQLVSLTLAISSLTISLITKQGVDAPLSVSFFTYLTLAVVYGTIMLCRRQKMQLSWYWYVLLGFVDVHGNYLVVKAYEYTSITSVTLLDCSTIAWVIILTWLLLGTRYTLRQLLGVGVSLLGLALLLFSDYDPTAQDGSIPLFGDILVVAGTVFLSMSNVGIEFCAKKKDRVEVMAMLGVFGMLGGALGMATYERKSLESITCSPQIVYAYVGCTITSFMFYSLSPLVLKMSGATMFNLSLLTSDVWVLIIRTFIYNQQVKLLYYPAYALVVVGIFVYLRTGKDETIDDVVVVADDLLYCSIPEEENGHNSSFISGKK